MAAIHSGLLVASVAARADDATDQPEGARNANGLEEVVVTAQRREENLQRSAVPITAIDGENLTSLGITRAEDLTTAVPALQIAQAGAPYNAIYLRGIGNIGGNAFSENSVAFNYDGVYISRPSGPNGMFFDLQRVEVLKGPQGTLYGRNASGGAINVVPVAPRLGEFGGTVNMDVGNFDSLKIDGALNLPIGETMAIRFAAQRLKRDGYYDDGTGDADGTAGRIQFRLEPGDSLSLVLSGDYYKDDSRGDGATLLDGMDFDGLHSARAIAAYNALGMPEVGRHVHLVGFRPDPFAPPLGEPAPAVVTTAECDATVYKDGVDNVFWGTHATLDWTTAAGTLTFIPAYRKTTQDFVSLGSDFIIDVDERDEQSSAELRFASDQTHMFSLWWALTT